MEHTKYHVVITDCDHGSIDEEKEEFGRIGAKLVFAQVKRAPKRLVADIAAIPGIGQVQARTFGGATREVAGFSDPVTAQTVSLPDQGRAPLNARVQPQP